MLGLVSIPKSEWGDDPEKIVIDRSRVSNGGSLYARKGTAAQNLTRMKGLEENLNHIFDIAFGIAPCWVIERLFLRPLGMHDAGPFKRIGREVDTRYVGFSGNPTQQDAYFVSARSLIGVELKIGAKTWPGQVLKYLALMVAEEKLKGRRDQLGLLYVTPNDEPAKVFAEAGIDPPGVLPNGFVRSVPKRQKNQFLEKLLANDSAHFEDAASRLVIRNASWKHIADDARKIATEADQAPPRDETLARLMSGFAEAVGEHAGTNAKVQLA